MTDPNPAQQAALDKAEELRAKQEEQRAALAQGKPTPTQEELDKIKLGVEVELEKDGSKETPPA